MKNSQKIQIKGSPGAVISDIHYTVGTGAEEQPEVEEHRPVRVLFLAANPDGTSRLRLDQEAKAIAEALRSSRLGQRFELQQSWAVGDRELQDGLLRYEPDIVHWSGHGRREGGLVLEEESRARNLSLCQRRPEDALAKDPRVLALARIFAAARGKIRCVVLNACHSIAAAQKLAEHVGCVIGMSDTIEDSATIRFSWSFYNALGYGSSVKGAFDLAVAQVALGGWAHRDDIPRLVVSGIDPAVVVFA